MANKTKLDEYINNLLKSLPWHKRIKVRIEAFIYAFIAHFFRPKKAREELEKWINSQSLAVRLMIADYFRSKND